MYQLPEFLSQSTHFELPRLKNTDLIYLGNISRKKMWVAKPMSQLPTMIFTITEKVLFQHNRKSGNFQLVNNDEELSCEMSHKKGPNVVFL